MDDQQWLQSWQAVCQKEAEMKIKQEQSFEKFRMLEMKMKLMDMRVDTAFKIRDDYLNKLLAKYPSWNPKFVSVGLNRNNVSTINGNKTELAIARLVDMDLLQNWDDKLTLEQLVENKMKNEMFKNSSQKTERDFPAGSVIELKTELEHVKRQLSDITVYLRDLRNVPTQDQTNRMPDSRNVSVADQSKYSSGITRRTSFRDRDYSSSEYATRYPRSSDAGQSRPVGDLDDRDEPECPTPTLSRNTSMKKAVNEVRPHVVKREPQNPVAEIVSEPPPRNAEPPIQSGPRFNFGPPKESPATSQSVPQEKPKASSQQPVVQKQKEPEYQRPKQQEPPLRRKEADVPKKEPQKGQQPESIAVTPPRKQSETFFGDNLKEDENQTSTPESTPEIAKSTKVQSYAALLGIVKEKSFETKKPDVHSDSDSDSDEIEKNLKKSSSATVLPKTSSVSFDGRRNESLDLFPSAQNKQSANVAPPSQKVSFSIVEEKKLQSPPYVKKDISSSVLPVAPKEQPKPASAAKKEEPLSDPDDFLAKLFPDKFSGGAKKTEEKPKTGGVASLFGDRKPKKSAFFLGDDSDSETVDIPKKKKDDDDFDFFN